MLRTAARYRLILYHYTYLYDKSTFYLKMYVCSPLIAKFRPILLKRPQSAALIITRSLTDQTAEHLQAIRPFVIVLQPLSCQSNTLSDDYIF